MAQVFSSECCKSFTNAFFTEHLRAILNLSLSWLFNNILPCNAEPTASICLMHKSECFRDLTICAVLTDTHVSCHSKLDPLHKMHHRFMMQSILQAVFKKKSFCNAIIDMPLIDHVFAIHFNTGTHLPCFVSLFAFFIKNIYLHCFKQHAPVVP